MERGPGEWQPDAGDELIEAYLDELLLALRGRPRDARRLLAEAEGHLRESVADGVDAGLGRAAAAEEAIRRFGPPSAVTRGVVCGAWLGIAAAVLLVIGIRNVVLGADSTAGVIGSGDLAATGATMMAAALCCGAVLAQRVTGWPRRWQRHPAGAGARHPH